MNSKRLPLGSLGLAVSMIAIAWLLGHTLSSLTAVLLLMGIYWGCCWLLTHRCSNNNSSYPVPSKPNQRSSHPIYLWITWLPPLGVLVVLLSTAPSMPSWSSLAAILAIAIANGITEERFWRATFVSAFPQNIRLGLLYPTLVFTLWHIAFLCIPNVSYEGGAFGLVGGAAMLGGLWGYAFWQSRNLRSITLAHITTNFLAFTMLAQANWL